MSLPEYEAGDVIRLHGYEYEVDRVDVLMGEDRPHQYRLIRLEDDAPAASLEPKYDGGVFVSSLYREVDPDDVDRVD